MAMIKCSECGADASDKAAACPKCGNPINEKPLAFSLFLLIMSFTPISKIEELKKRE